MPPPVGTSPLQSGLELRGSGTQILTVGFTSLEQKSPTLHVRSYAAPCWTGLEGRPRTRGSSMSFLHLGVNSPPQPLPAAHLEVCSCPKKPSSGVPGLTANERQAAGGSGPAFVISASRARFQYLHSGPHGRSREENGAQIPENCDPWDYRGRVTQWALGFERLGSAGSLPCCRLASALRHDLC